MSLLARDLSLPSLRSQLTLKDFGGSPSPPAPSALALTTPRNLTGRRKKYVTWLWMASPFFLFLVAPLGWEPANPDLWLSPDPGHWLRSLRVIRWVRLLGVWLNQHSLVCMAILKHHVSRTIKRGKANCPMTALSGFLTAPTQEYVSSLPSVTEG